MATAYRYWRFRINTSSPNDAEIQFVRFCEKKGGVNIATDVTKAISGSEFSGSFINDYAFDENDATRWAGSSSSTTGIGGTRWVGYDFTTPKEIREIRIRTRAGSTHTVSSWAVDGSNDGTSWTEVQAFATTIVNTYEQCFYFQEDQDVAAPIAAQYWRVRFNRFPTRPDLGVLIKQVEFRTSVGGANVATTATNAISGSEFSTPTWQDDNAFDNNGSTRWAPTNTPVGFDKAIWVGYNFGSPVAIAEIVVHKNVTTDIQSMSVDYSTDGSTWTEVYFEDGITWSGGDSSHTMELAAPPANDNERNRRRAVVVC